MWGRSHAGPGLLPLPRRGRQGSRLHRPGHRVRGRECPSSGRPALAPVSQAHRSPGSFSLLSGSECARPERGGTRAPPENGGVNHSLRSAEPRSPLTGVLLTAGPPPPAPSVPPAQETADAGPDAAGTRCAPPPRHARTCGPRAHPPAARAAPRPRPRPRPGSRRLGDSGPASFQPPMPLLDAQRPREAPPGPGGPRPPPRDARPGRTTAAGGRARRRRGRRAGWRSSVSRGGRQGQGHLFAPAWRRRDPRDGWQGGR